MTVKRNRRKNTVSFDQRLVQMAAASREAAEKLPDGEQREALLQKARQAETAAHMNEWLSAPGLQSA